MDIRIKALSETGMSNAHPFAKNLLETDIPKRDLLLFLRPDVDAAIAITARGVKRLPETVRSGTMSGG